MRGHPTTLHRESPIYHPLSRFVAIAGGGGGSGGGERLIKDLNKKANPLSPDTRQASALGFEEEEEEEGSICDGGGGRRRRIAKSDLERHAHNMSGDVGADLRSQAGGATKTPPLPWRSPPVACTILLPNHRRRRRRRGEFNQRSEVVNIRMAINDIHCKGDRAGYYPPLSLPGYCLPLAMTAPQRRWYTS